MPPLCFLVSGRRMYNISKQIHRQTGDVRRVVTFPLSELDSSTTGPAAQAPLAPWTPVTIHMLRDGSLTDTFACPAPLTKTY